MGADFGHFYRVHPLRSYGQDHGTQEQLALRRVEEEAVYGSSCAHAPEGGTAEGLDDGALDVVEDLEGVGLVDADHVLSGRVEGHLDHWGLVASLDKAGGC